MSRIELTNVTKRWGQFYAVDNLSMVIEDNAFVTLLGPSGCGKTTTLRMIAGLEMPTSGRITIDGVPVFDSQRGINVSANKRKVGFLFQNYALWPNMTVYQNISFGLTNIKEEMDEIDFDARAAARMIEILQKPQDVVRAINECVDKKKKLNMDKAYLRLIDLYEISLFTAKALMGMKLHEAGDPKAAAAQEIKKLEEEVRSAAYKIIEAKRATYYGIGMAMVRITRAILGDENSVLTVSAMLESHGRVFAGMPCIVNRSGVRRVLPLSLTEEEEKCLAASCETLREAYAGLRGE
mgnify:CR=1 FL=1